MPELYDEEGNLHDLDPHLDGIATCPKCQGNVRFEDDEGHCQNCNEHYTENKQ